MTATTPMPAADRRQCIRVAMKAFRDELLDDPELLARLAAGRPGLWTILADGREAQA